MPKPRPLDIHVNSLGKKHMKLQEIIHSESGYYFISMTGKQKTDFYNKGIIDGAKTSVVLYETFEDVLGQGSAQVLAFPREPFATDCFKGMLTGRIPLDKTFLISSREAGSFIQEHCWNCGAYGSPNCFKGVEADYIVDCGKEDRERYRDSSWFEFQKEKAQERKERKRTAFPA